MVACKTPAPLLAQAEDFYGQAKGKAGEYYDAAKGEAGGYVDAAGNYVAAGQRKAGEAYDAAKGKAGEYADSAQVLCRPAPNGNITTISNKVATQLVPAVLEICERITLTKGSLHSPANADVGAFGRMPSG